MKGSSVRFMAVSMGGCTDLGLQQMDCPSCHDNRTWEYKNFEVQEAAEKKTINDVYETSLLLGD